MVGSGQLAIRRARLLYLLGDGFDGRRAIDGLLGAGDVGQPKESSFPLAIVIRFLASLGGADKGEWRGLRLGAGRVILTVALPS